MAAVEVKKGVNPSFSGSLIAILLLVISSAVTSGMDDGDGSLIPSLVFDNHPFRFIEDYLAFFFTTTRGWIVVGATSLFYIGATYYVQKSQPELPDYPNDVENDTAAFLRGLLIGLGSSMNFVLAYNIYGTWFGTETDRSVVGLIIGIALFALGMLSSFKAVSQNGFYQGLIGWLNWFAPMSWPAHVLGLLLALLSLVLGLIGLLGVDFLKVGGDKTKPAVDATVKGKRFTADWMTGTFFLVGGLASNANPEKTAFNMGNIGFIYREATADFRRHEAGHNLSLFVFGWIFHFIGAIDQMIHSGALAERLAESHDPRAGKATLEMWA